MDSRILAKRYIFNEEYILINDKDRIVLSTDGKYRSLFTIIHPVHAIMLSFFNGEKVMKETLDEICSFFSINKKDVIRIIQPFVENKKDVWIEYDNNKFCFPGKILVENNSNKLRTDLLKSEYFITPPYNFSRIRFSKPRSLVYVINTNCVTDCIYCYANRQQKYSSLSTERILSIINDARHIGMLTFSISGGEFFLHKDWKIILKELINNKFTIDLSTKIPLKKDDIDFLSGIGLTELQVSLDSLDPILQKENIGVSISYINSMKKSLKYLDEKNIQLIVKGTQTRYTCNKQNINEILEFIKGLKNIKRYTISTIGCSQYKPNEEYHQIKPTLKQIDEIDFFINDISNSFNFEVYVDNQAIPSSSLCNYKEFRERSLCTANVDGFVLLPDGKVTICEELYWNKDFVIGDLSKQTILEMWNSKKAIDLWNLSQNNIPKQSKCSTCQDFDNCRKGKGVCWKMIVAMYGKKNYLYPDPRCPKAPDVLFNVCYDGNY